MARLPEPVAGIEIQLTGLLAVQLQLSGAVMLTTPIPPEASNRVFVGEIVAQPVCVTAGRELWVSNIAQATPATDRTLNSVCALSRGMFITEPPCEDEVEVLRAAQRIEGNPAPGTLNDTPLSLSITATSAATGRPFRMMTTGLSAHCLRY
jgi:hypothetical protein